MRISCLVISNFFVFWLTALASVYLHVYLFIPTCGLPILRATQFCQAFQATGANYRSLSNASGGPDPHSARQSFTATFCGVLFVNDTLLCRHQLATDQDVLSSRILEEFYRLDNLLRLSSDAPRVVEDIRDVVMAIGDLVILVRHSELKNKVALVEELQHITAAGKQCSRVLQAYTARLSSALGIIIASAEVTTELATNRNSISGHIHDLLCSAASSLYQCRNPAQDAFLHTIQVIEFLLRKLGDYNTATDSALVQLEERLEGVMDIVGEEAHEVKAEIGELLSRLWTRLGGNRGRISEVKLRFAALARIGVQTRVMRTIAWNVHQELGSLQLATEELRAGASEPLLVQVLVPQSRVVQSLTQGARELRARVHPQEAGTPAPISLLSSLSVYSEPAQLSTGTVPPFEKN